MKGKSKMACNYRVTVKGYSYHWDVVCGVLDGGAPAIAVTQGHNLYDPNVMRSFDIVQSNLNAFDAIDALDHMLMYFDFENIRRSIRDYEDVLGKANLGQIVDECVDEIMDAIEDGVEMDVHIDEQVRAMVRAVKDYYRGIDKASAPVATARKAQRTSGDKPGYVYVLQSDSGFYKIGRTTDYKNRLKTFHSKLPFRVDYLLLIKSDAHIQLEQSLHTRFWEKRKDGEWFALRPTDIETLRQEYKDCLVQA